MNKRLYSRQGCLRCRARQKKCDEQRPECEKCQKSGIVCVWAGSDEVAKYLINSSKILSDISMTLWLHPEICSYEQHVLLPDNLQSLSYSLSPGFVPIRSQTKHYLLTKLAGFLNMLISSKVQLSISDHDHVFAAGLQNLSVRNAMIAFSAFVSSARMQSLRLTAYEHYHKSIRNVRNMVTRLHSSRDAEEMLIASLFLGMIEVSRYHAVGRLVLTKVGQ